MLTDSANQVSLGARGYPNIDLIFILSVHNLELMRVVRHMHPDEYPNIIAKSFLNLDGHLLRSKYN